MKTCVKTMNLHVNIKTMIKIIVQKIKYKIAQNNIIGKKFRTYRYIVRPKKS